MPHHFCIVTDHRTVLPELVTSGEAGHESSVLHLLLHQTHFTAAHLLPLRMASSPNSEPCRNVEGLNELTNFKQICVQVSICLLQSHANPQSYLRVR